MARKLTKFEQLVVDFWEKNPEASTKAFLEAHPYSPQYLRNTRTQLIQEGFLKPLKSGSKRVDEYGWPIER